MNQIIINSIIIIIVWIDSVSWATLTFFDLGKGSEKQNEFFNGIFHKGGGVPPDFGSVSILFFYIFKHGLN